MTPWELISGASQFSGWRDDLAGEDITVLAEDPESVSSTHVRRLTITCNFMSGDLRLFGLCGYLHACGAHKPTQVFMHLHEKLAHSVRNTWGHDDVSLKNIIVCLKTT